MRRDTGAVAVGLMLASPDGDLRVLASSSEAMRVLEVFESEAHQGPCVDCYRSGAPVAETHLDGRDGRWLDFAPRAVAAGFLSVQALPMQLRGRTIRALNLYRRERGQLSERLRSPDPEVSLRPDVVGRVTPAAFRSYGACGKLDLDEEHRRRGPGFSGVPGNRQS